MVNQSSSKNGKKKALIIAVSDYDYLSADKQLSFCRNDGETLYNVLKEQGYDIPKQYKLIGKVKYSHMKRAISKFFKDDKLRPKDLLLFYFSGHGYFDSNDHYLVTSNMDPKEPDMNGYLFLKNSRE